MRESKAFKPPRVLAARVFNMFLSIQSDAKLERGERVLLPLITSE